MDNVGIVVGYESQGILKYMEYLVDHTYKLLQIFCNSRSDETRNHYLLKS